MKKIVLTFGLISGAISATLMLATVPFHDQIGFDRGMFVGYTSMVLSFLLVFFGIRSYRENVGNGEISFLRAFSVGILITLITCVCYVATWEIVASRLMPDFIDKYSNYAVAKNASFRRVSSAGRSETSGDGPFRATLRKPFLQNCNDIPGTVPSRPAHYTCLGANPQKKTEGVRKQTAVGK
jgi:hypothetical protein